MKKRFSKFSAISFQVIALTTLFSVICFAWVTLGIFSPEGSLSFTADKIAPPGFSMWVYDADNSTYEHTVWKEISGHGGEEFQITPTQITETDTGGTVKYSIDIPNLQFGSVDNLISLKDSNYVYMRFKFDTKEHGCSELKLNIGYVSQTDYIRFFGKNIEQGYPTDDGNFSEITDPAVISEIENLSNNTPLLGYSYCVSTEDVEHTAVGYGEFIPFGSGITIDGEALGEIRQAETYYVYIRLNPNLEAFSELSTIINSYMPCVMFFKTVLEAEVR